MILLAHLLFGAAIGHIVGNPAIAIILAFLSHYFLDFFPHIEYPIENIRKNQWQKAMPDILRIILDFSLGIFLIFVLSKTQPIIYICALFAILPDGLTVMNFIFTNKILDAHKTLHRKKVHFLKDKKISNFWRVFSQVAAVVISIFLIKS